MHLGLDLNGTGAEGGASEQCLVALNFPPEK